MYAIKVITMHYYITFVLSLPVVPMLEKNLPESNSKSLSRLFSFLSICLLSGLYRILVVNNRALLY